MYSVLNTTISISIVETSLNETQTNASNSKTTETSAKTKTVENKPCENGEDKTLSEKMCKHEENLRQNQNIKTMNTSSEDDNGLVTGRENVNVTGDAHRETSMLSSNEVNMRNNTEKLGLIQPASPTNIYVTKKHDNVNPLPPGNSPMFKNLPVAVSPPTKGKVYFCNYF